MLAHYPRILAAGDVGWTVEFGSLIDPEINDLVLAFTQAVEGAAFVGLQEVVPTYRSVMVYFDPIATEADRLAERLRAMAEAVTPQTLDTGRTVDIPVIYGGECGPDLTDVAAFAHLSVEEAAALHSSVEFGCICWGSLQASRTWGESRMRWPSRVWLPR